MTIILWHVIDFAQFPTEARTTSEGRTRAACLNSSYGAPHPSRAAGHLICPVPGHTPDHGSGEPVHHPTHQAGPSASHTQVLLLQPLGPQGHLHFICHCP